MTGERLDRVPGAIPPGLQDVDVLGGLVGELQGVQAGHVLELGHDHPLTHVQREVVAQDVGPAGLVGAPPAVGDLRLALGRAILQAQGRQPAQPLPPPLLRAQLPRAQLCAQPGPEGAVQVLLEAPVQGAPALSALLARGRQAGDAVRAAQTEPAGDHVVQPPAQQAPRQHRGLV